MSHLYLLQNLKQPPDYRDADLPAAIAATLKLKPAAISNVQIVKRSLDARSRRKPGWVLQVVFHLDHKPKQLPNQCKPVDTSPLDIPEPNFLEPSSEAQATFTAKTAPNKPVIVVGAGPAGLFAALGLALAGAKVTLLERGKAVEPRMRDIGQLRSHGTLDPESNVCFGEGGAGTYTDGKLYTRIKHPYVRWVMKTLVNYGAPEDILIEAHPHLGTDKLVRLVARMRSHLLELGVEIRFETKMQQLLIKNQKVAGVQLHSGETLPAEAVVLGIGHSARDTLATLLAQGIVMEPKPFAVGVRAEHPQSLIDRAQYGDPELAKTFGAAAYRLTHQVPDKHIGQRGVYSFCMCPGGFIVPSPTEIGHMAINGMSNANRSAPYANSGIVVQVTPEDLQRHGYPTHPLIGIQFQRELEEATFKHCNQPYAAPAMKISDLIAGKASGNIAKTHFRPAAEPADLREILPSWILQPMIEALKTFDRKIKGYAGPDANLLAIESRTSAPLRITRDERHQAIATPGLYPVGEGAGYAGGIVSAAVDGLLAAESLMDKN